MKIAQIFEKWFTPENPFKDVEHPIRVYPSQRSCIQSNMSRVPPEKMPPLMVRKASWRK